MELSRRHAALHVLATIVRGVWSEIPGGSLVLTLIDGVHDLRLGRMDHVAKVALEVAGEDGLRDFLADLESTEFLLDAMETAARTQRASKRAALGEVLGRAATGDTELDMAQALASVIDRVDVAQIKALALLAQKFSEDDADAMTVGDVEALIGTYAYWSLSAQGLLAHRDGYGVQVVVGVTDFASEFLVHISHGDERD